MITRITTLSKLAFTAVLLLLSTQCLEAQILKPQFKNPNLSLWAVGGFNGSMLLNQPNFESPLYGMVMGAALQQKLNKTTTLEYGLNYERKGSAQSIIYTNVIGTKVGGYIRKAYLSYT